MMDINKYTLTITFMLYSGNRTNKPKYSLALFNLLENVLFVIWYCKLFNTASTSMFYYNTRCNLFNIHYFTHKVLRSSSESYLFSFNSLPALAVAHETIDSHEKCKYQAHFPRTSVTDSFFPLKIQNGRPNINESVMSKRERLEMHLDFSSTQCTNIGMYTLQ
jgi:hypothetical protein